MVWAVVSERTFAAMTAFPVRRRATRLLLPLLTLLALPAFSQEIVADHAVGSVFHDRDADGVRDEGEEGLAGVPVSNGREVVVTGEDGRWRLPVAEEAMLFVVKPRGWMTARDRDNHPTFAYFHRPKGSTTVRFPGFEPTGPLPASIDFPLVHHDEPDRFQAVVFGDPQVRNQQEIDYLSHDLLDEVALIDAAFGLTLGDNAFDDLNVLPPLKAALGTTPYPWYYTLGNHDENYDADSDAHADETYQRIIGPANYAFNWGPVHFIVLDDVVWDPEKKRYSPGLSAEQLEFVRNDLALVAPETLVVYAMHIPVEELPNKADLFALFAGRPNVLALSGHTHTQYHTFFDATQGWPNPEPHHSFTCATACGAWWSGTPDEFGIPVTVMSDGAPNGYIVATFDGSDYSLAFRAARRPVEFQMQIDAPEVVRIEHLSETLVSANVFAGSDRSTVEMRVLPEGGWITMAKATGKPDPTFVRMSAAQQSPPEGYRKANGPGSCNHLWEAPLPAGLEAGSYRIEVRTTDLYGQTYTGSRVFRVE